MGGLAFRWDFSGRRWFYSGHRGLHPFCRLRIDQTVGWWRIGTILVCTIARGHLVKVHPSLITRVGVSSMLLVYDWDS